MKIVDPVVALLLVLEFPHPIVNHPQSFLVVVVVAQHLIQIPVVIIIKFVVIYLPHHVSILVQNIPQVRHQNALHFVIRMISIQVMISMRMKIMIV
jgi:hypothetical protein